MIDYKKAKDIIESNSMELIWTEEEFNSNYKSITITKIPVICSCKRIKELKLTNIRNGSTCRECANERIRNMQKQNRTTFATSLDIIKKYGFKFVWTEEEYNENFKSMNTAIPVICENCGKESNRKMTNIKSGSKCKHCVVKKTRLLKYEEVNEVFTKNKIKLLWDKKEFSEKFTGSNQKIPVICICGENKELCYTNVIQGHKCQDCGNNRKKNYDEILKIVEDKEMKLNMNEKSFNDIYKSMNSPITILCKCEKEYTVRINDVKFGYSCKECGIEKSINTNIEKYGVPYAILNEEIQAKIKNTNMEKYGVEFPFLSEEINAKIKNTNIEKYGVENPFLSEEIQAKIKNTNIEKYGVEFPFLSKEIKEKIKNTNIEKYGVEFPFLSDEIQAKIKNTVMKKYGVENPMQNEEIFKKSQSKSSKIFTFPSGKLSEIHGYEHFALQELLDNGIFEEDIVTDPCIVPEIWYIDSENKKRRHYVDIYIKSQNKCIEVKSLWTLNLEKNMNYKQNTAKANGYEYEIWVYDHKGVKLN